MGRLLILSCSQRKAASRGRVPALDRYDGPAFRILRKFLREAAADDPIVLILSAKYGLIDSAKRIPDYDCRMSMSRAKELRPAVLEGLSRVLRSRHWGAIGLCLGKVYRAALEGMEPLLPEDAHVEILGGGQGQRLANLRRWLRCERPCRERADALRGERYADQRP
jgi:hypothetical protein